MRKQKKIKQVLVRKYHDWPFQEAEIEEGAKMFGFQRLSSVVMIDNTSKNKKLTDEYNRLHAEHEKLRAKMDKILDKMK